MNNVAQMGHRETFAPAFRLPSDPRHQPLQAWCVAIVAQDAASFAWAKQETDVLASHAPARGVRLANWDLNLLRDPAVYSQSIASLARADLIVVSIHDPNRVPSELYPWTNLWLDVRSGRPGTLVVLLDASQGHTRSLLETRSYWHAVAAQGGLEIVVKEDPGTRLQPETPSRLPLAA